MGFLSSSMNAVCHRLICDDAYTCPGQTVLSSQGLILRLVPGHLTANWHFIRIPMNCLNDYVLPVLLHLALTIIVSFFRVHSRNLGVVRHQWPRTQWVRHYQGLHIGGCCWFWRTCSGNFLVESSPLPGTVMRSPVMGLAKSWMLGVEERMGCGERKGVAGLDPGDADDSDTGGE